MDQVEDYIWGRIDETEYLRDIVANDSIDEEQLLPKLETIQQKLNTQLRQGVEENYPRLLEQVSAIEVLDNMQVHFDKEMQMVSNKAKQMGNIFSDYAKQLRTDILAIQNLTKMNRILSDGMRCEMLVKNWQDERDLIRQAELFNELNLIIKGNEKLKQINWINEKSIFKIDELSTKTRAKILEQLKISLKALNCSTVSGYMKALTMIMDSTSAQNEINIIMNDACKELDSLFLQWSMQTTTTTTIANDKISFKLLPQLGNRLHSFLEQFQLLGLENVESFARQIGKIILSRVSPTTPNVIRLVQTIYKCLITHNDGVIKIIRDSMNPLKTSILSRSLSTLFSLVDDAFAQDEKKGPLIVEKLNLAMKSELQSVNWDSELVKEMEGNISKTLKYISVKIEQQIQFNEDTLRLIGRVSKAQLANYQMLCVAFEFTRQWPQLAHSITNTIIEPSIQALMDRMKTTIKLVLESMHDTENMLAPLPSNSSSSLYMKELCDHLKVFRTHIQQIQTILEYQQNEKLPQFLDFILSQFLQHISQIRPLTMITINRCVKDFEYLCRFGLQPLNCKSSKLLNQSQQISDLLREMPTSLDKFVMENENNNNKNNNNNQQQQQQIPDWLLVNLMINVSGTDIHLPYISAGWSLAEFIEWFDKNCQKNDLWQFYNNLLISYKQSVVKKNATEYVKYYPILAKIVARNLKI